MRSVGKGIAILVSILTLTAGVPMQASAHYRQSGLPNNALHHHGGLLAGLGSEANAAHLWVADEGAGVSYWGAKPCYDTTGYEGPLILWMPTLDPDPSLFGDASTGECGPARTEPGNPEGASGRAPVPGRRGVQHDLGGTAGLAQTAAGMDLDALTNMLPIHDPQGDGTADAPWYTSASLVLDPWEPYELRNGGDVGATCSRVGEIALSDKVRLDVPCVRQAALSQDPGSPGRSGREALWIDWAGGGDIDEDIALATPGAMVAPGVLFGRDWDVEVDDSIATFLYHVEPGIANPLGVPTTLGLGSTDYVSVERRDLVLQTPFRLPEMNLDLLFPKLYLVCLDVNGDGCTNAAGITGTSPSPDYAVACRTAEGARAMTGLEVFWGTYIAFNDPDTSGAVEPCQLRTLVNADGNGLWASASCRSPLAPDAYQRWSSVTIGGVVHPPNYALDCDFGRKRTSLSDAPDDTTTGMAYGRLWDGVDASSVMNAYYPGGSNPPSLPPQRRPHGADQPDLLDAFTVTHVPVGDVPFRRTGPGTVGSAGAGTLWGDLVSDCNDARYSWARTRDDCYGDPGAGAGQVLPLIIRDTLTLVRVRGGQPSAPAFGVTVTRAPPFIREPGETARGDQRVGGVAHDNVGLTDETVTRVDVEIDDGTRLSAPVSPDGSWQTTSTWNTCGTTAGRHSLTARSVTGNTQSAPSTIEVNVSNTPEVWVETPGPAATVVGNFVARGGSDAPCGAAANRIQVRLDERPWIDATGLFSWQATVDTRMVPDGDHMLEARIAYGTSWQPSVFVPVVVENRPRVGIDAPSSGDGVWGLVTIEGTASDLDVGVEKVEVRVGDGPWNVAGLEQAGALSTRWAVPWESWAGPDGRVDIEARSFDGGQYSTSDVRGIYVNNDPPQPYTHAPNQPDEDGDGMGDAFEDAFLLQTSSAADDLDGDGLANLDEFFWDTIPTPTVRALGGSATLFPNAPDHDRDHWLDGAEAWYWKRDACPVAPACLGASTLDTDGDGYPNIHDPDSDDDGLVDGFEARFLGTSPGSADSDCAPGAAGCYPAEWRARGWAPSDDPTDAVRLVGGEAAAWQMDDDDHDATDQTTRDATATGHSMNLGGASQAPGRWGSGYALDGSTHLAVPDDGAFSTAQFAFSASWRPTETLGPSSTAALLGRAPDSGYRLWYEGGRIKAAVQAPTGPWVTAAAPATLPAGAWSHIAASFDNERLRLFVDGSEVANATAPFVAAIAPGELRIGNATGIPGFAGIVDEAR
ncbi:MAG: LamG-like jellyroll fold domain-containing protein, partial [Methanobacteriota archaeon]